ncbi:DMT family transporter [Fructilactobacillus cliffordii]|uniref:DMT family transporter n=1 Tax=Fructilactobacillus cliffordii TaxID=2940299 RepID=UPI00209320A8|nr:DMT family transporter [Fructilactobacillus cliffordii]USS85827.1 DMT family transporter [Fructilactobacillus cliffordii]
MNNKKTYLGVVLAIAGALMWGIQGPVSEFLYQDRHFSTEWLMGIKMLVSGILILFFVRLVQHQPVFIIWKRQNWLPLICYAVLGLTGVQYFFLLTVRASNPATATIMQSLGTVMIVILTAIVYRQLPSRPEAIAVAVAMVGTWLLVTKGDLTSLAISPKAFELGLLVALAGALQTMLPVKLIQRNNTLVVIGWAMLIGGLIFSCIHPMWVNPPHLSVGVVLGVGFIVIFGTMLAFICFVSSLHYVSPTTAGLLDTFEPLSATLLTVWFFHTSFNLAEIIGGILILSTVFILAVPAHKQSSI